MKKIFFYLIICLSVLSCSKNDDDKDSVAQNNASANSYWPLKMGNEWNYVLQNGNQTRNIKVNERDVYQNREYFKVGTQDISGTTIPLFTREDLGVFTMYLPETELNYQTFKVKSSPGVIKFIDTNLNPTINWQDQMELALSITLAGTLNVKHVGKVIENNVNSININNVEYNDVIKVETTQTITNQFTNLDVTYKYVYWLAKGIGPIHIEVTDTSGTEIYELTSYSF